MSAPLPDLIDPWHAVQAGFAFAGDVPLERLPRLAESVLGADGPARYTIAFGRDADGRAVVRGRVSMTLRLTCQRCLESLAVPVDVPIALALAQSATDAQALGLAAIADVPDGLDPLPLGRDPICPMDLVEDELLLAIPLVPSHRAQECRAAAPQAPTQGGVERRENPFAVLAALRGQDRAPGLQESAGESAAERGSQTGAEP